MRLRLGRPRSAEGDLYLMTRVLVPSGKLASRRVSKSSANQSVRSIRPIASEPRNCPTNAGLATRLRRLTTMTATRWLLTRLTRLPCRRRVAPPPASCPVTGSVLPGIDAGRGDRVVARRDYPQDSAGTQHDGCKGQYENPRTPPENQQNLQGGHLSDPI